MGKNSPQKKAVKTMNEKNKKSLSDILKTASKQLGTDPETLQKAASKGDINNLLKNIGTDKAEQISEILSDKNKASQLLSSPKAQSLLKKFFGG